MYKRNTIGSERIKVVSNKLHFNSVVFPLFLKSKQHYNVYLNTLSQIKYEDY